MAKYNLNFTHTLAIVKITASESISLKTDLKLSNERVNTVLTTSGLSGGTGYTNGQSNNISTTGGTGTGLKVNITVASGIVTKVTLYDGGSGYTASDTITISGGNGNATFTVASISADPKVNIKGFDLHGETGSVITITRNGEVILTTAPEHVANQFFEEYTDNIQSDQDISVNISGSAQIYLKLRKESGYLVPLQNIDQNGPYGNE
jgi:hypothetical protein